jgi:Arc/MetJ-type ribon-helix-helix transcriptional regulator
MSLAATVVDTREPEAHPTVQKISVSIDARTLRALDALTSSGAYATRSAAIQAAVQRLELDLEGRRLRAALDTLTDEDRADNHELAEMGVEDWAAGVEWE